MNYTQIIKEDVINGAGMRVSIFLSGCDHRCKGCFNRMARSYKIGELVTLSVVNELIEASKPKHIRGLSLLGGDPLAAGNLHGVLSLLRVYKSTLPEKDVWLWTGDTFEEAMQHPEKAKILNLVDYVVDGEYVESQRDLTLRFRGSRNQRIFHKGVDVTKEFTV